MNLHSIFIHFPIACLVLYSCLECLSFVWKSKSDYFKNTKIFLLITWVVFAFISLQTGEVAEELLGRSTLTQAHSQFADITYSLYLIILVIYIISREVVALKLKQYTNSTIVSWIVSIIWWIQKYWIMALLSLIAMVVLSITWALWGAISHGPSADPVVQFVYDIVIWQ